MHKSNIIIGLSLLIAVLAFIAAGVGVFGQEAGSSFSFTTLRGQTIQMVGQGLYRYDTLFTGPLFQMVWFSGGG